MMTQYLASDTSQPVYIWKYIPRPVEKGDQKSNFFFFWTSYLEFWTLVGMRMLDDPHCTSDMCGGNGIWKICTDCHYTTGISRLTGAVHPVGILVLSGKGDHCWFDCVCSSGSGSAARTHWLVVWVELKQSSQRLRAWAHPVKQMEYRDGLIWDHFLLPVMAAWRRKAASYLTHARPEKSWLTQVMVTR